MQVHQFMRKATSPEVCLYPAAVETWVQRHKYDVSPEEPGHAEDSLSVLFMSPD